MTLDEAINHCLERANQDCSSCADEHLQLAEWLIELKKLRKNAQVVDNNTQKMSVDSGYCKSATATGGRNGKRESGEAKVLGRKHRPAVGTNLWHI